MGSFGWSGGFFGEKKATPAFAGLKEKFGREIEAVKTQYPFEACKYGGQRFGLRWLPFGFQKLQHERVVTKYAHLKPQIQHPGVIGLKR